MKITQRFLKVLAFLGAFTFGSQLFAWNKVENGVWQFGTDGEKMTVAALGFDEKGSTVVKFSTSTSSLCNGASYILLEGNNDKETKRLMLVTSLAHAIQSTVFARIQYVTKEWGNTCKVVWLYQN